MYTRGKDDTVFVRMNKKGDKSAGKVEPDNGMGEEWLRVQGSVAQISVGSNAAWGVKGDGTVSVRIGITNASPQGQEWITVDGEPMRHVSCSNQGHVWAIDKKDKIWYRKGANNEYALGQCWKTIPGSLKVTTRTCSRSLTSLHNRIPTDDHGRTVRRLGHQRRPAGLLQSEHVG